MKWNLCKFKSQSLINQDVTYNQIPTIIYSSQLNYYIYVLYVNLKTPPTFQYIFSNIIYLKHKPWHQQWIPISANKISYMIWIGVKKLTTLSLIFLAWRRVWVTLSGPTRRPHLWKLQRITCVDAKSKISRTNTVSAKCKNWSDGIRHSSGC